MYQRQEQDTEVTFSQAPAYQQETASAASASYTPLAPPRGEWRQIEPLLKRLLHNPIMREVQELQQDIRHPALIPPLIEILRDPSEDRWRERVVAAWALGWLPLYPEQKTVVAGLLCALLENRQTSTAGRLFKRIVRAAGRSFLWALACGTLSACLFSLNLIGLDAPEFSSGPLAAVLRIGAGILSVAGLTLGILCLASPLVFPFSFLIDVERMERIRTMAATTLERLRVPESVGALARATLGGNLEVQRAAAKALCAVVPTLTPEHYGQLSSGAVPGLCDALARAIVCEWSDYHEGEVTSHPARVPGLVAALLEALGKVGDGRAVPYVQHLTTASQSARLRSEAAEILPILLERQRQENERSTLVRGACMPVAAPEQLLRSASADTQASAPEQLLRSSLPSSSGMQAAVPDIPPGNVLQGGVSGEQA